MGMVICNGDHKKAPLLEVVWSVPCMSHGPVPWSRLFPVLQAAAFLQGVQELAVGSESQESVVCGSGVILKVSVCI